MDKANEFNEEEWGISTSTRPQFLGTNEHNFGQKWDAPRNSIADLGYKGGGIEPELAHQPMQSQPWIPSSKEGKTIHANVPNPRHDIHKPSTVSGALG